MNKKLKLDVNPDAYEEKRVDEEGIKNMLLANRGRSDLTQRRLSFALTWTTLDHGDGVAFDPMFAYAAPSIDVLPGGREKGHVKGNVRII